MGFNETISKEAWERSEVRSRVEKREIDLRKGKCSAFIPSIPLESTMELSRGLYGHLMPGHNIPLTFKDSEGAFSYTYKIAGLQETSDPRKVTFVCHYNHDVTYQHHKSIVDAIWVEERIGREKEMKSSNEEVFEALNHPALKNMDPQDLKEIKELYDIYRKG